MNKTEMSKVLSVCAALDNQQVTEHKVMSWLPLFERFGYEEVEKLVPATYLESKNGLVTPQDLVKAVDAAREPARPVTYKQDEADLDEVNWKSDPHPVCEEHGLMILKCDDCCSLLFVETGHMWNTDRLSWAMTHVYKPKVLWV